MKNQLYLSTLCKKFVDILKEEIFFLIEARRSLIAIPQTCGMKASTQRKVREKELFKMLNNLLHGVLSLIFSLYATLGFAQFSEEIPIFSCSPCSPKFIETADIDQDGDQDVLLLSYEDGNLFWYENIDNGNSFQAHIIDNIKGQKEHVKLLVVDFNGDGDMDIFTTALGRKNAIWLEIKGRGEFEQHELLGAALSAYTHIDMEDLDGDGKKDLLLGSNWDNRIIMFRNEGSGGFMEGRFLVEYIFALNDYQFGDIDGDGDLDLVTISATKEHLVWFANGGKGYFGERNVVDLTKRNPQSIQLVDFNLDGNLDIALLSSGHTNLEIFLNSGSANFNKTYDLKGLEGIDSGDFIFYDWDEDGDLDYLAFAYHKSKVLLYIQEEEAFAEPQVLLENLPLFFEIKIADLNNDNQKDLVLPVPYDNSIYWFEKIDNVRLLEDKKVIISSIPKIESILVENIDADEYPEIILRFNNQLFQFDIRESSEYAQIRTLTRSSLEPRGLLFQDLDQDLDKDLVYVSGRNKPQINFFERKENNFNDEYPLVSLDINFSFWSINDLNHDAFMDLLMIENRSNGRQLNQLLWLKNYGDLSFSEPIYIPVEGMKEYFLVKVGDFNGDRINDLLVGGTDFFDRDQLILLLNDGLGSFKEGKHIAYLDYQPWQLEIIDFEKDGDLDIFLNQGYQNPVSIIENIGEGNFAPLKLIVEKEEIDKFKIVDWDGDEDLDLFYYYRVFTHQGTISRFYLIENEGQGNFGKQKLLLAKDEEYFNFWLEDFDQDQDYDLLVNISDLRQQLLWYENLSKQAEFQKQESQLPAVKVYPNPFTEQFALEWQNFPDYQPYSVLLFNASRQLIYQSRLDAPIHQIKLPQLSPGMYTYQILGDKVGLRQGKIIKVP